MEKMVIHYTPNGSPIINITQQGGFDHYEEKKNIFQITILDAGYYDHCYALPASSGCFRQIHRDLHENMVCFK